MADLLESIKGEIRILDYAEKLGFTPVRVGTGQYSLKEHDSVRIDSENNLYYQHSSQTGGSIVDFVMNFEGKSQDAAIRHLRKQLASPELKESKPKSEKPSITKKKELVLNPKATGKYSRSFSYLVKTRGIDPAIVQQLMKEKLLYEDNRGNVCFVGKDYDGNVKYGFARSTASEVDFRGDMNGSDKSVNFSVNLAEPWNAPPQKIFVSESAIDCLSLMTLTKIHGLQYEDYGYLSLSGVNPKALEYHIAQNPQIEKVYLCQDNDVAGNKSRVACMQMLDSSGYTGKVVDKVPKGKDFNDDLRKINADIKLNLERGINNA